MALGKAYDGNAASLGRLGLGVDANILKSKDFNLIFQELTKTFGCTSFILLYTKCKLLKNSSPLTFIT